MTLAHSNALYPMSQAMVEELGGPEKVKSMNNENMCYNGCYTMTEYIQGNEKIFTKNPLYWTKKQNCLIVLLIRWLNPVRLISAV